VTETELQRAIIETLKTLGFWVVRTARSKRRGRRDVHSLEDGFPDLMVLQPLMFMEVKLPGGVMEETQVKWHAKAKEAGLPVCVVESARQACQLMLGLRTEQEHRDRMGWERTATG